MTLPGFIAATAASLMSSGALRPGTSAVVIDDVVRADVLDHPGPLALLLLGRQLLRVAARAFGIAAEVELEERSHRAIALAP